MKIEPKNPNGYKLATLNGRDPGVGPMCKKKGKGPMVNSLANPPFPPIQVGWGSAQVRKKMHRTLSGRFTFTGGILDN